jgi:hypothetical protein
MAIPVELTVTGPATNRAGARAGALAAVRVFIDWLAEQYRKRDAR